MVRTRLMRMLAITIMFLLNQLLGIKLGILIGVMDILKMRVGDIKGNRDLKFLT